MLHIYVKFVLNLEEGILTTLREHGSHVLQISVHALSAAIVLVLARQVELYNDLFRLISIDIGWVLGSAEELILDRIETLLRLDLVARAFKERDDSAQVRLDPLDWLFAGRVVNIDVNPDLFTLSEAGLLEPDGRRGRRRSQAEGATDAVLHIHRQVGSTRLRLSTRALQSAIGVGHLAQDRSIRTQD